MTTGTGGVESSEVEFIVVVSTLVWVELDVEDEEDLEEDSEEDGISSGR